MSGRIEAAFQAAAEQQRAAFVAYLTAGFPDEERFLTAAMQVLEHADVLEVGVPFSDPLGDGPTIQRAGEAALAGGMTTAKAMELVRRLRERTEKPLLLMTYYNPIYCFPGGDAGFVRAAVRAGVDGVILPDLPPDEGQEFIAAARGLNLDTIFLVAPTSTPERLRLVGEACRGFVYAVSVTGVTGARAEVPDEASEQVAELVAAARAASGLPVAVGFGVGTGASAARVARMADGVVVGSALIDRLASGADVGALAAEIAAGVRQLA